MKFKNYILIKAIYIVFFHDPKTQIYFVYIFTFDNFSLKEFWTTNLLIGSLLQWTLLCRLLYAVIQRSIYFLVEE